MKEIYSKYNKSDLQSDSSSNEKKKKDVDEKKKDVEEKCKMQEYQNRQLLLLLQV